MRGAEGRIHKDLRELTENEQRLYFEALKVAKSTLPKRPADMGKNSMMAGMEVGPGNNLYDMFVLIHANEGNAKTAYNKPHFETWHRKFLLEFETMLRSLDSKFKCVKIPHSAYWDWAVMSRYRTGTGP